MLITPTGCSLLIRSFGCTTAHQFVGFECLKLNGICATTRSYIDKLQSKVFRSVVIDTCLCNYESFDHALT
jgi:hypothetical protein